MMWFESNHEFMIWKKEWFESKVVKWRVGYFCDSNHVWVSDSSQTKYDLNHT